MKTSKQNTFSAHIVASKREPRTYNILLLNGAQQPEIGQYGRLEHSITESGRNVFEVFARLKEAAIGWFKGKNIPLPEDLFSPDGDVTLRWRD